MSVISTTPYQRPAHLGKGDFKSCIVISAEEYLSPADNIRKAEILIANLWIAHAS